MTVYIMILLYVYMYNVFLLCNVILCSVLIIRAHTSSLRARFSRVDGEIEFISLFLRASERRTYMELRSSGYAVPGSAEEGFKHANYEMGHTRRFQSENEYLRERVKSCEKGLISLYQVSIGTKPSNTGLISNCEFSTPVPLRLESAT